MRDGRTIGAILLGTRMATHENTRRRFPLLPSHHIRVSRGSK